MNPEKPSLRIVLLTSDTYPPFRPAARAIFSQELIRRGHHIDWILQAEKDCARSHLVEKAGERLYVGATVDSGTRLGRLKKHVLGLINDFRLWGLVKESRYDVIQVKDKYLSALFAILVAWRFRRPFVYWLAYPHAEASLYAAKMGTARYRIFYLLRGWAHSLLLYKLILPRADHVFVQSEQMARDLADHGTPMAKMTPVPGSVNLADIPYDSSVRASMIAEQPDEDRVVYLGTLIRERQLDFLIRAFALALRERPHAKLYLLGRGETPEDEAFLTAEVDRQNLSSSVIFTGHLPMTEAWEHIRRAGVCVSPYYPTPILNSTSPTKLIEYMAMAKAVVANDHPEQTLVINESGGGLVVPWHESEFAAAIVELLRAPEMAVAMGLKGRAFVERYRTNGVIADVVEQEYLRLYRATDRVE